LVQEGHIRYRGGILTAKQCYVKYVTLLPKLDFLNIKSVKKYMPITGRGVAAYTLSRHGVHIGRLKTNIKGKTLKSHDNANLKGKTQIRSLSGAL
jgi:hypothetical protein